MDQKRKKNRYGKKLQISKVAGLQHFLLINGRKMRNDTGY